MKIDAFKTAVVALALLLAAPSAMAAEKAAMPTLPSEPAKRTKPAAQPAKVIDINRAGKTELTKLWGIDGATAEKIIAGRPYRSKADLAARKIVPAGIYFANRKRIIAGQHNLK